MSECSRERIAALVGEISDLLAGETMGVALAAAINVMALVLLARNRSTEAAQEDFAAAGRKVAKVIALNWRRSAGNVVH